MDMHFKKQDNFEDSGCVNSYAYSETPSSADSNSCLQSVVTDYSETPTTTIFNTRKRKISNNSSNFAVRIHEISSTESPAVFESSNLLCSTLNDSLTQSLESCNIAETETPIVVQAVRPSITTTTSYCNLEFSPSKKTKYDEEQPTTHSAPSTPTKSIEIDSGSLNNELNSNFESTSLRYPSDYLHYTPLKSHTTVANGVRSKLGSPERLALLYPNIKLTGASPRLKTPEKLRDFLKKINSPAKKRLFDKSCEDKRDSSRTIITKKIDRDPVSIFCVRNNLRHIMSTVFSYLSESDLCNVSKVSRSWRRALNNDHKAFPRFYTYSREFDSNKENIFNLSVVSMFSNPPGSPPRDKFSTYTKIASQLRPNQSLQKCIQCMSPAVVQKSVSQCQNQYCSFISCNKCLSFSTRGPEYFVDKCNSAELVVNSKQRRSHNSSHRHRYRFSLNDMSNDDSLSSSSSGEGQGDVTSFFNDTIPPSREYDSSGYLSWSEKTGVHSPTKPSASLQIRFASKVESTTTKKAVALQEWSRNYREQQQKTAVNRCKMHRASLVEVVSPVKRSQYQQRYPESPESSSPPRRKMVACSKQSKKNLRRLHL